MWGRRVACSAALETLNKPQHNQSKHDQPQSKVAEPKKDFYKRFLYQPFPVESSLHEQV